MEMCMAWEKWAVLRNDEPWQIFATVETADLAKQHWEAAEPAHRWAIREVIIQTDVGV